MNRDSFINSAMDNLRYGSWIPSSPSGFVTEIVTFGVICALLYFLIEFFHNNSIQTELRKKSRCIRSKEVGRKGGQYVVNVVNKDNQKLYTVGYDLSSREVSVECACPEGKVANTFNNIPIYNLNTLTTEKIKEKLCACDQSYYRPGESVYYTGYPSLVSFMNSGDLTFFKDAMQPR